MTTPPVLSVSQVEDFDPEQLGGCPRRWWFERVQGHRTESTAAHADGEQGHALLARYLSTGERPGRVRLGKAVSAVIVAGRLPTPGPHLQVEQRFSGQPHRDASGAWVPLDASRTLWHAGHPWEGFIDLRFRHRDGTATVWDHKFSSDIHARALPADRLLRTVQMPIYALDTLRHWPDARAVNLVHLYVSRRGAESFIRHQRVSVEQVRERAEEISGLVRQMDAVRGATAQDDVPFNRAACHARTGCPHQFRCNAFRRKSMDLTEEEKRMFGMLSEEKPAGPLPVGATGMATMELRTPAPARVTEPLERPKAGPVTPPADLNLDDIFTDMPKLSEPKPQPAPTCEACSAVLTPENSSRLKSGDVKHIGCPKAKPPVTLDDIAGGVADRLADSSLAVRVGIGSAPAPGSTVVTGLPGASAQDERPAVIVSKCPDCPHPAHAGKPCEGKRGRGACRCGVASVSATAEPSIAAGPLAASAPRPERPAPPVPPKVHQSAAELEAQAVEAERAADLDGDGAAVEEARVLREAAEQAKQEEYAADLMRAREAALADARARITSLEESLRTAREIIEDPELGPRGSWSGTLAVNVIVELGPSTLAFLAGLVKR